MYAYQDAVCNLNKVWLKFVQIYFGKPKVIIIIIII